MQREFKIGDRVKTCDGVEYTIAEIVDALDNGVLYYRQTIGSPDCSFPASSLTLVKPNQEFKSYRYKPNSENDFNKVVAEWEDMGYEQYTKFENRTTIDEFPYLRCDSEGDWFLSSYKKHLEEYFPKYKEKTGPKYLPADSIPAYYDIDVEKPKTATEAHAEGNYHPFGIGIDDLKEDLVKFKQVFFDKHKPLLNNKPIKKMNTLRENIWNRFYKKMEDKIADLVEELEDAIEELSFYPTDVKNCIASIEIALEDEDKKRVEKLYKELKKWSKIYKSDEYFALINSKQGVEDLIEKTFKD